MKIIILILALAVNSAFGATQINLATQASGVSAADTTFKSIAVSGASTVSATATLDTLNLVAGSGIAVTTNASTKTVTVSNTVTGGATTTSLPAGWVDVVADYGAACNGSTTDDTAFANAIASGKNVYIPGGTTTAPKNCKLSATLHPLAGQMIKADNWVTAYLTFTGTTNWLFDIDTSNVTIEGVRVVQSGTPTAGGHFRFGYPCSGCGMDMTNRKYNVHLFHIYSSGAYIGLENYGESNSSQLHHVNISNPVSIGVHIDLPSPSGDLVWEDITVGGGDTATGLYVRQLDTSRIFGLHLQSLAKGIWLRGDNGAISGLHLSNITHEDIAGDITIGDGSYSVAKCTISQVETYKSGGIPSSLSLGSHASDITFSQLNMNGYKYVDGGTRNTLANSVFYSTAANTVDPDTEEEYSAITLAGSDAILSGTRVKSDYHVGITMTSAGTYAALVGNNSRETLNPFILDSGAKATGKGQGNIGIADW